MLTRIKIQQELPRVTGLGLLSPMSEQVSKIVFGEESATHDAHNFIEVSVQFHLMLNDCHQVVGSDGRVYLYADSRLGVAPKRLNPQMLFDPFEEQLNLPAVRVKKGYLFGCQEEVVGIKCNGSVQLRDISHYASNFRRVIVLVTLCGESYSLILKDILILHQVSTSYDFVFWSILLSYYKEGVELHYMIQTGQIPVPSVKYITGQGLIGYIIHCIDIQPNLIFKPLVRFLLHPYGR